MKSLFFLLALFLYVSANSSDWKLVDAKKAVKVPLIKGMIDYGVKKFGAAAFQDSKISNQAVYLSRVNFVAVRVVSEVVIGTNEDGTNQVGEANVVKFNADIGGAYGEDYDVDIVVIHLPDREGYQFLSYLIN